MSIGIVLGTFLQRVAEWLIALDAPVLRPDDLGETVAPLVNGRLPPQFLPLSGGGTPDPPPPATGGCGLGPTWIAVGDSTTGPYAGNGGWPAWAAALLPGATLLQNAGVAGNTTVQVKERLAEIIAQHPAFCTLLIGVNNIGGGIGYPDTRDDIIEIHETLQEAGIPLVVCTVPSPRDWMPELNAWLRVYAAPRGLIVIPFDALLRPDGTWPPGYALPDETHPLALGAQAMGTLAANTLRPYLTATLSPLARFDTDPSNLWPHATCAAGADPNHADTPLGWSKINNDRSGHTCLIVSDSRDSTGTRHGWQITTDTATENGQYGVDILNAGVSGDRMEIAGLVTKQVLGGDEIEWWIGVDCPAMNRYNLWQAWTNVRGPVADGTFHGEFVLPEGFVGPLRVYLFVGAGNGSAAYTLYQPAVRNLNALSRP